MKTLLTGKITFVADGTGAVGIGIVRSLLIADATVIVPGKSAVNIKRLKEKLADIPTGNLITFLTDYPDYDKAFEVGECMEEKYGKIDLAVIVFDPPKAFPHLTGIPISDWQQMIDENITATFVCAHVFLNCMKKRKKGMYISICNAIDPQKIAMSVLEDIAVHTQVELAKLFAAEVKEYGIQYYHLFVEPPHVENKDDLLNPATGDSVIRLFTTNNVDL